MFDIQDNLKKLPDKPGVYIHKDRLGKIIYVGKAVSLKNRVRQYFQSSRNMDPKVRAMVSHIAEFEYITCGSEMEALILECNLIKRYNPRYNILLRDDKTYPYIKVTLNEEYPRILKTRRIENDGARYFGPYSDTGAVNRIVEFLENLYTLKRCSAIHFHTGFKPCLNYHISQCRGVCSGNVSREEYMKSVDRVIEFLNGNSGTLIEEQKALLEEAASSLEFEKAACYRDNIAALQAISEKQRVVLRSDKDMDLLLVMKGASVYYAVLFYVREGKLSGRETFPLSAEGSDSREEMMAAFIKQYYSDLARGPGEILTDIEISDAAVLAEYLESVWGRKVRIFMPQKGEKRALMDLARKDVIEMARTVDGREEAKKERDEALRNQIDSIYGLQKSDAHGYRVEAYDISDINGIYSVGAMVVFDAGRKQKKEYRRFRIKTVEGPDDYASMKEVLGRRFRRALEGDSAFEVLPDIILIDGGRGHVAAADEVLRETGLDIVCYGMAKDDSHRTRELVYLREGEFETVSLKDNPLLFRYIGTIQEEVHRFAIDYHRNLRTKGMISSVLDEIDGIGPVKRNALLAHFGSIDNIRSATREQLMEVPGILEKNAENILKYFRQ